MSAYGITLFLHSWIRWAVVVTALMTLIPSVMGWLSGAHWTDAKTKWASWFVNSTSIQLVLGLILYGFLSPMTLNAFNDFGAAMKDRTLRFWAVEHITMMIIAVAVVHIGSARIKKASSDVAKHRVAVIFFTAALLIMFSAIPWGESVRNFRGL